jgi:CheY-like chemotaxis protein
MKNILIADDEELFLKSISAGLKNLDIDLNVITAENGKIAIDALTWTKVDLLITDIKMPVMDGFELLAYVSRKHPDIPILVMTAFADPAVEDKLKVLGFDNYLEKPLDFEDLSDRIIEILHGKTDGFINGIALSAFVQMLEIEKKSCTLKITSKDREGYLFLRNGVLIDARTDSLKNIEAAYEIISWERAGIEINSICRRTENKINLPLTHILLEGMRMKDEANRKETKTIGTGKNYDSAKLFGVGEDLESVSEEWGYSSEVRADIARFAGESKKETREPEKQVVLEDLSQQAELEDSESNVHDLVGLREDQKEIKEIEKVKEKKDIYKPVVEKLDKFKDIDGFLGVGVFSLDGDLLAKNTGNLLEIETISALITSMIINADKASEELDLGKSTEIDIVTSKDETIYVRQHISENNSFSLILVCDSDAQKGMVHLRINHLFPSIIEEIKNLD